MVNVISIPIKNGKDNLHKQKKDRKKQSVICSMEGSNPLDFTKQSFRPDKAMLLTIQSMPLDYRKDAFIYL